MKKVQSFQTQEAGSLIRQIRIKNDAWITTFVRRSNCTESRHRWLPLTPNDYDRSPQSLPFDLVNLFKKIIRIIIWRSSDAAQKNQQVEDLAFFQDIIRQIQFYRCIIPTTKGVIT